MKIKISFFALAILVTGCATTTQHASQNSHWGYSGHEGPEYWGTLDAKYSSCDKGVNQSPVNLTGFIESELPPLELAYKPGAYEIINNGHTIQINYQSGSKLTVNGHSYELKQFHFHSPSENHINGKSYPLEAHLVHADAVGNLAVVAVIFEEGSENKTLKKLWDGMPEIAGNKNTFPAMVSVDGILPINRDYYRFNGSLTTPPCSEGVLWLVMKQSVSITKEQISRFTQVMPQPTNRPVQAINARAILK